MAVFFVKIMKRFRLKQALYNTMSIVELPRSTVNLKVHVSLGTQRYYVKHLPYKFLRKVCHVHVVLSRLFWAKMITVQEVEDMNPVEWIQIWHYVVQIQCTKPPRMVARTVKLLTEIALCREEANALIGQ